LTEGEEDEDCHPHRHLLVKTLLARDARRYSRHVNSPSRPFYPTRFKESAAISRGRKHLSMATSVSYLDHHGKRPAAGVAHADQASSIRRAGRKT
jgi:hypothetical protein